MLKHKKKLTTGGQIFGKDRQSVNKFTTTEPQAKALFLELI